MEYALAISVDGPSLLSEYVFPPREKLEKALCIPCLQGPSVDLKDAKAPEILL